MCAGIIRCSTPFHSGLTDKLHEIYQRHWELCCTRLASQDITRILRNPKVHCRIQNNPPFFLSKDRLSQSTPTNPPYTHPSKPGSSNWCIHSMFSHQNSSLRMLHALPSFLNFITWITLAERAHFDTVSPFCTAIPLLGTDIFPSSIFSHYLTICSSHSVTNQISCPHKVEKQ
jgi:hypothetical protein